ncbi:MAG: DUF6644 family protein [Acidobacteriota bacterium]
MGILAWLESNPLSVWVHESPSVWAQPTVLTLHTMGMAVLVGASWVFDLRLLGINRNVPLSAYRWVFRAVAVGLFVNLVTGVLLFAQRATTLGTSIPFLIKMALVIVSVGTLVPLRSEVLGSGAERLDVSSRARLLAIISILAWSGAIAAGRLLAYLVP